MQQTKRAKKSFESTGECGRKMGRPRLRWLEDAENGILGLKLKKWKEKANNKEQWASVVKKTNVLKRIVQLWCK
jgi:hypothetical protein